jgi:hypothetical protein
MEKVNKMNLLMFVFSLNLVASILNEYRFGLDMSLITRIYYIIIPYQIIPQEQIRNQLKVCFYFNYFGFQFWDVVYLFNDSNRKI